MNAFEYASYKKMIYKAAWSYAKKCRFIPFEEFLSEGNLIFVEAIESFDPRKGTKFGTHLYSQLGRLVDLVDKEFRRTHKNEEFDQADILPAKQSESVRELLENARISLDEDAFEVLQYLVSFDWHSPTAKRQTKPSKTALQPFFTKKHGWSVYQFTSAWAAIENFWKGWQIQPQFL